jgi:hypothetical protein
VSELPQRVREIEDWFLERSYVLAVTPVPHGGYFAAYFPSESRHGNAPFTWGETAEEAAEAAQTHFTGSPPHG